MSHTIFIMAITKDCANPVIEIYKGHKIRKFHRIDMRLDITSVKQLIDIMESTGLSPRIIFGLSSKPCDCCRNIKVTTYNKDGDLVEIDRGLLSKRIPKQL